MDDAAVALIVRSNSRSGILRLYLSNSGMEARFSPCGALPYLPDTIDSCSASRNGVQVDALHRRVLGRRALRRLRTQLRARARAVGVGLPLSSWSWAVARMPSDTTDHLVWGAVGRAAEWNGVRPHRGRRRSPVAWNDGCAATFSSRRRTPESFVLVSSMVRSAWTEHRQVQLGTQRGSSCSVAQAAGYLTALPNTSRRVDVASVNRTSSNRYRLRTHASFGQRQRFVSSRSTGS